jgi:hypothetical protein
MAVLVSRFSALGMAAFLILAAAGVVRGQAASLTAALDRDTAAVGEPVTLTLSFEGGAPRAAPVFPAIPNLSIAYAGQGSQVNIVNGRMSSTVSVSYSVVAAQPGDYTIPAIRTVVNGQTVSSQALKLKVLKAGDGADPRGQAPRLAFLRTIVPKTTVYLGEVFPVDTQLYVQSGRDVQLPQLKADGFTLGKTAKPTESRTQIGNAIYSVVTFRTTAIAAKTGELTLGPAECTLKVQTPRNARRSRDPFGLDLFDLFNDPIEWRVVTLQSEPVTMTVLPLPAEGRPPQFSGAVGDFSLTLSVAPTNVAVGDPITVRVQVAGRGSFDGIVLPPQPGWDAFKLYPATSKTETTDELGLQGVKTFEHVVVPQMLQTAALPEFSLSYFDPEQKRYQELKHPATPLVVRPSAPGATLPPLAAGAAREPVAALDLLPIQEQLGGLAAAGPPLHRQAWFLGLQLIPLALWLAALVWRRRAEWITRNPHALRQREVARKLQGALADMREHARQKQPDLFYATLFRALQEQLGERLDLPASSVTEAVIEQHLRPAGADPAVLDRAAELFHICNQARYAPTPTAQELQALLPTVEQTLEAIRGLKAQRR